jgi:hypothetical protein
VKEEEKQNLKIFVYGVLVGVLGNFLVSFVIECSNARTFVERTSWEIATLVASLAFFHSLIITGRDLGFPEKALKLFRKCQFLSIIIIVTVWILELLIVPLFFLRLE